MLLLISELDTAKEGTYATAVAVEAGDGLGGTVMGCSWFLKEHADNMEVRNRNLSNVFLIVTRPVLTFIIYQI